MDIAKINWNEKTYQKFLLYLESLKDIKYQEFNKKIVLTKYPMLGIKIPALRSLAQEIKKGAYQDFLKYAKNTYLEEILLKGLVIAKITNLDELIPYFNAYLDLMDNWCVVDTFCNSLKIVSENKDIFLKIIAKLIETKEEYKVRTGLVLLLNFYVEKPYLSLIFNYLDTIKSDLYYLNMASAWLLCEVFIKYPKETLTYLEKNNLNDFTMNKTISKIRDSYRVSKETKDYLLKYKRKPNISSVQT